MGGQLTSDGQYHHSMTASLGLAACCWSSMGTLLPRQLQPDTTTCVNTCWVLSSHSFLLQLQALVFQQCQIISMCMDMRCIVVSASCFVHVLVRRTHTHAYSMYIEAFCAACRSKDNTLFVLCITKQKFKQKWMRMFCGDPDGTRCMQPLYTLTGQNSCFLNAYPVHHTGKGS